jgi:hypothetical protein
MLIAIYLPEPFERYIEEFKILLGTYLIADERWIKTRRLTGLWLQGMLALYVSFCCRIFHPSTHPHDTPEREGYSTYYPTGSLKYIKRSQLSGNLLTEFGWGEYLIWNLAPEVRVALDGRYETVYQDRVTNEYFDYMNGKENGFLDAYAHDFVLLNPESPPVAFRKT